VFLLFINILKENCHECYACVRNCPVSAVKVNNSRVEVIEERCINCGKCVELCSQNAREIVNNSELVLNMLKENKNITAVLAPSFPAYKINWQKKDWELLLKEMNFKAIHDVAWGAELVSQEYIKIVEKSNDTVISTACPVIVKLINKYYPKLTKHLASVVSPMQAVSRYLKKVEPDLGVVIIGPCQAKKIELEKEENVKAVLTFSEIFSIAEKLNIKSIKKEEEKNDNTLLEYKADTQVITKNSRSLAVGGALYKKAADSKKNSVHIEGEKQVLEFLDALENNKININFADVLFCQGCLDGFDLRSENYYLKEKALYDYIDANDNFNNYDISEAENLNLSQSFEAEEISLSLPDEKEIWDILNKTNKFSEDDLLDCGACGYNSCRDKAVAVYQGFAEVNICLPYLLREKRKEVKEIQQINKDLDLIINSSYDGIMLLNKEGKIDKINQSYLKMLDLEITEIKGKYLKELEEKLNIYPAFNIEKLKEKEKLTFVQNTSQEKRILLTAKAIRNSDGILKQIIINARDLAELDLISSNKKSQVENIPDYIISKSSEMQKILKLASKIAKTDSTVLITGESGVGKEVVAKYIYDQSEKKNNFVKINCAAIPETLLESELFGYEKGAFSGARKSGKPGLIEEADKGTLFLDEIGELSLNMQAKLLQVLQEHSVFRIGSVKPKEVDFRLIAATNRNLEKMVAEKEFREDLYYRLNVLPICIPPLRKRKVDIPALAKKTLTDLSKKYDKEISISDQALEILVKYDWPGNVREVNNIIERLILTVESNIIRKKDVISLLENDFIDGGISVSSIMPLSEAVEEVEKKILEMAKQDGKSTYEIADMLKVNQSTVVRKINKYFN
jgi:transcriptional regulator with PAS, ATPase and Fis domain/iron only hydrogenase large subunit-like protein